MNFARGDLVAVAVPERLRLPISVVTRAIDDRPTLDERIICHRGTKSVSNQRERSPDRAKEQRDDMTFWRLPYSGLDWHPFFRRPNVSKRNRVRPADDILGSLPAQLVELGRGGPTSTHTEHRECEP